MRSVPLARRSVLADPRRLAVTVLGVGTALALILLLWGLWEGLGRQAGAYPVNVGADLFIAEAGVHAIEVDSTALPLAAAEAVAAVPGVGSVSPVLYRYTVLDLHDRKLFARLGGAEPDGLGGPWSVVEGRAAGDGQVVIDRSLAAEHGLALGDRLDVLGGSLEVVGLSDGSRSFMTSFLFTTHATAAELLRAEQVTNLLLVATDQPGAVADTIQRELGLAVLSPAAVAASNREVLTGVMAAPVGLMIAVAFAAGTMVTALSVYSAVVERVREYGVAKALGASGWRLLRTVVGQTLVVTAVASAAGYGIFRAAAWTVVSLRPHFALQVDAGARAAVLVAAGGMALLGALAPLARVVRLDPATVYRG
jgi:putative ABC transport system permease protein